MREFGRPVTAGELGVYGSLYVPAAERDAALARLLAGGQIVARSRENLRSGNVRVFVEYSLAGARPRRKSPLTNGVHSP
jgi:hypothetical protein